ncbi:MAG: hypothetical protein ACK5LC_02280 [Coprobacillaceae bacterium]
MKKITKKLLGIVLSLMLMIGIFSNVGMELSALENADTPTISGKVYIKDTEEVLSN